MTDNIYSDFQDYVKKLGANSNRTATTIKPFIKIERLTYGQLQFKIYKTAAYLNSIGLKKGDRIMIIAPNSPQWVELLLGAQILGITIVPVDVRNNLATVENYERQTKPVLIFHSKYLMYQLDSKYPTEILDNLDELTEPFKEDPKLPKLSGEEDALIVFTSGTTADPKGVVLSQTNILSNVYGVQKALTIEPEWRFLSVLPLSHMYELTGGCLVPLSSGASIYYLPRVTPLAIARGLNDYQITTILAVPQLLILFMQRILQAAEAQGKSGALATLMFLSKSIPFGLRRHLFHSVHKKLGGKLDIVVAGGAPTPIEVASAWEKMGVKIVAGYGLTETSPVLTFNRPSNRRLDSQGQPLHNLSLRVAKSDNEIQASGPNIFKKYLDNPNATKEAFTADGWFRTGDIGKFQNSWLQIQGRAKFAIVLSSGLKVFPEDIEIVAEKDKGIKFLCIVGLKLSEGEAVQAVVISSNPDKQIDKSIENINSKLEDFQHISSWVRWPKPDFPRTRLLKIDRKAVAQWTNSQQSTDKNGPQDRHDSSDPIINILRLALNKPSAHINETDRLSDIGLDSLRRLSVVSLIEEQLSIGISETEIDGSTTLAKLRSIVESGKPAESPQPRPTWPYSRSARLVGNFIREKAIRLLLRIWVKQKTEGVENLSGLQSQALFIFNHADNLDAPVVYKSLPKSIRKKLAIATASDVMKGHKFLAFVDRLAYAGFEFSRKEPFMPSLEYVGKLVDLGWNIALAPEGKLTSDGKLLPFKSGIGLLAVELGVPVVVVKTIGLYGTAPLHSKFPKKHSNIIVRISQPISFGPEESYDETTEKLHEIMKNL